MALARLKLLRPPDSHLAIDPLPAKRIDQTTMTLTSTVYHGAVVNPTTLTSYEILLNCLIAVSSHGDIEWMVHDIDASAIDGILREKGCPNADTVILRAREFVIPGFIDTHTHAPQVPNIGSGQQYELLDWLKHVTFPTEAKFADDAFAGKVYRSAIKGIINSGTTTCCYYGTLHLESTKRLAEIVHEYGQRAFVGKCNMDRNSPEHYVEGSAEASLADTKAFIDHVHSLSKTPSQAPLVLPILTPRFAISCTRPLLIGLGALAAADPDLRIQTHISENPSEIAFTKELFPECSTYAGVYDAHGLLRSNTVLAHGVHLEEEEIQLIAQRGAGVSHCPTSNFNLSSGVAPIGKLLDRGIKVGLGTDVSGGFSPSILTTIQHASIAAKVVAMRSTSTEPQNEGQFTNRQFSVATLLYLATVGGARVCDLEAKIGSFGHGKSFDALVIHMGDEANNPGCWVDDGELKVSKEAVEQMLERFLFCGDDRNIQGVYVQGRCIGGTSTRT